MVGAMGGGDAGIAAISAAQAASCHSQLRYSRTREQEADRIGLSTMMQAGLDPNGMARMFERMQQAYRFTRTPPEFLLTHPLSESRISDARQQALRLRRAAPRRLTGLRDDAHAGHRPLCRVTPGSGRQFERRRCATTPTPVARYGLALACLARRSRSCAGARRCAVFRRSPSKHSATSRATPSC
jgi:beta-barrel assembly-enhancing protease